MADKTTKSQSREDRLDKELEESFPASDPLSVTNPSTGVKTAPPEGPERGQDIDRQVQARAAKLWRQAGKPGGGADAFLDEARTLIAVEDNPKAGHAAKSPGTS